MSASYIIRPAARQDIDDAYDWYELQAVGRGDSFLIELRQLIDAISQAPELYGRVYGDLRAAPLPASNYIVYYRIEATSVSVYAVIHATANPRKWQRRR
ncbi:MAG: type II toxin-antitoxin system RelE/ParE family toxin [Planctomycetes bacterium]|nr:type II toxin-antitoxin system RelE/ParE family toxin [Planctomycetota bacterium]